MILRRMKTLINKKKKDASKRRHEWEGSVRQSVYGHCIIYSEIFVVYFKLVQTGSGSSKVRFFPKLKQILLKGSGQDFSS